MDKDIIITQARSWIGTKFHHQGRRKHVGVDCIGLIVGVCKELGIETDDRTDYAREPSRGELQKVLVKHLQQAELQPATIALFRINKEPQHVGIISDYNGTLGIIHAYAGARKVVEHGLDEVWRKRLICAYHFPS